MALRKLYHPTLNASVEVPEKDADSWAKAGWRKTPKPADDAPKADATK